MKQLRKNPLLFALIAITFSSCNLSKNVDSTASASYKKLQIAQQSGVQKHNEAVTQTTAVLNTQTTDLKTVNVADNSSVAVSAEKQIAAKPTFSFRGLNHVAGVSKAANHLLASKKATIRKSTPIEKGASGGDKSQIIALVLCVVVGTLGIHRFYLGYIGVGILELLTAGCCGILTLIDLIRIITGSLQPKDGSYSQTF